MKNIRNPIARMLHIATRNRVMGVDKKYNKKKERLRINKTMFNKGKKKEYKNDRRLQRQLKQTTQLKAWR